MARYRKKPVVIDAFKWTGGLDQTEDPEWIIDRIKDRGVYFTGAGSPDVKLHIRTLAGVMTAAVGDWIIRGVQGEIYPCNPDIFEQTYERAE